jgi:hypothetical protein
MKSKNHRVQRKKSHMEIMRLFDSYLGKAKPVQPTSTQAAPKQPTEEKVCDQSSSATPSPRSSLSAGLTIDKKGISQQIAKFGVRVTSNVDIIEGESITHAIRFVIQFMDGTESEPHTEPNSEIDSIDWLSLDRRCVVFTSVSKCDKIIDDYVKDQLAAVRRAKYIASRTAAFISPRVNRSIMREICRSGMITRTSDRRLNLQER